MAQTRKIQNRFDAFNGSKNCREDSSSVGMEGQKSYDNSWNGGLNGRKENTRLLLNKID